LDIYNSEQEQVEALKAWWDKNGRMTIAAIVVVLLSVLGWKSWLGHNQQRAEAASVAYQQMLDVLDSNPDKAMDLGHSVVADYPDSTYAVMASLAMAKVAVGKKDLDAAVAYLRSAMEQAKLDEYKELARLRLGEVLLAQGKADEALALLPAEAAPNFRGSYAELRGDILLSQGKTDAARDAYTNALAAFNSVPEKRSLVQMKLDNLAENKAE